MLTKPREFYLWDAINSKLFDWDSIMPIPCWKIKPIAVGSAQGWLLQAAPLINIEVVAKYVPAVSVVDKLVIAPRHKRNLLKPPSKERVSVNVYVLTTLEDLTQVEALEPAQVAFYTWAQIYSDLSRIQEECPSELWERMGLGWLRLAPYLSEEERRRYQAAIEQVVQSYYKRMQGA